LGGHDSGYAYFAPRIGPKIGPTELQEGHTAQQGQNSTKTSMSYLDKVDIRDGGFLIEWGGLDSDRRFPAENTVKEVNAHYTSAGAMT
jgi:hypothetical protein